MCTCTCAKHKRIKRIRAFVQTYIHACTHIRAQAQNTHNYTHICIYFIFIHTCTCFLVSHMYIDMLTHMHAHIYARAHALAHTQTHIYTHTHTQL